MRSAEYFWPEERGPLEVSFRFRPNFILCTTYMLLNKFSLIILCIVNNTCTLTCTIFYLLYSLLFKMNISTEKQWNSLLALIPTRHLLTIIVTSEKDAALMVEYIKRCNLSINMAFINEDISQPVQNGSGLLRKLEYQFLFLYRFYSV